MSRRWLICSVRCCGHVTGRAWWSEGGWGGRGVSGSGGRRGGGNASRETSHDFERIAREVLAEHKATDEAEDEQFGQARGDELPEQLRTPEGRREFFRKARQKQRDGAGPGGSGDTELEGSSELESSSELEDRKST